ncbi:unnamed protein product [Lactuca virosa]|uniref:Uncharacterized protein n=1 Tax=Lactuca virosa TaxID=75947 RepID=A0AAU9NQ77_9ASTR|nr:unnamed protein product [Lactuca virosa]
MEVHNDPLNAPVDGPTQWPLRHLEQLLEELVAIAASFNCNGVSRYCHLAPNNAVIVAATPLCIGGFRRYIVGRSHGDKG